MKFNNACNWKSCRVNKTDGTNDVGVSVPRIFLCNKHSKIFYKLIRKKLSFGKTQRKRYLKPDKRFE